MVVVKKRDGEKIIDEFVDRKGGTIILKNYRIKKSEMLSFMVLTKRMKAQYLKRKNESEKEK